MLTEPTDDTTPTVTRAARWLLDRSPVALPARVLFFVIGVAAQAIAIRSRAKN